MAKLEGCTDCPLDQRLPIWQYHCHLFYFMEIATVKAEATTTTWLQHIHTPLKSTLNLVLYRWIHSKGKLPSF